MVAKKKKKIAEEISNAESWNSKRRMKSSWSWRNYWSALPERDVKSLPLTSATKHQGEHRKYAQFDLDLSPRYQLFTVSPQIPFLPSGSGQTIFSLSFLRNAFFLSVFSQVSYLDCRAFKWKILPSLSILKTGIILPDPDTIANAEIIFLILTLPFFLGAPSSQGPPFTFSC